MKILIISDSHGRNENVKTVVNRITPIDALIHLGDVEGAEDYIKGLVDCPIYMVSGNNDFFSKLPKEEEFTLGKYRIFITHGHRYRVYFGTDVIKDAARSREVDVVMFGHTHRPYYEREADLITLNPGSVSLPRQDGGKRSFMIMEIDRMGEMHVTLNYI